MRSSFSIVIPIHGERNGLVPIRSIYNQKYPEESVEVCVVEDDNANCLFSGPVVAHHDVRLERAISRTEGMAAAKNDWIIWLDSDDELISTTLYNLDYCIRKYPEYKIFHYGGVVYWEPKEWNEENYDPRTTVRPTPDIPDGDPGMGYFDCGKIAAGHFCFHRSLLDEITPLPQETSPYIFADKGAEEFPEMREMMLRRGVDSLGNPWGDDHLFFYKLTRKYKSKPLDLLLYCQHVRR